jgi:hypothetical protein
VGDGKKDAQIASWQISLGALDRFATMGLDRNSYTHAVFRQGILGR